MAIVTVPVISVISVVSIEEKVIVIFFQKCIKVFYHTHCCKGDAANQWEMAILGCQNSVTPEPID